MRITLGILVGCFLLAQGSRAEDGKTAVAASQAVNMKAVGAAAAQPGRAVGALPAGAADEPRAVQRTMKGLAREVTNGGSLAAGGAPRVNDACPATDAGVLSTGGTISGSTTGSTDDFVAPCLSQTGGLDEIFSFQVNATGEWQFTNCGTTNWDTTLSIHVETGDGCPGDFLACDGDGCGGEPWEEDGQAFLSSGTTYYLIVDGYGSNTTPPGEFGDFTVQFNQLTGLCTGDPDCTDGQFCNGAETCTLATGQCVDGPRPCSYEGYSAPCDEFSDSCFLVEDTCLTWIAGAYDATFFPEANHCAGASLSWVFDDVQGSHHTTGVLDYYTTPIVAFDWVVGASPAGTMFDVHQALFTVTAETCDPDTEIPGSQCTQIATVDSGPPQDLPCSGTMPLLPDNSGDMSLCEIDFFLAYKTAEPGAGMGIAAEKPLLGGPAGADDFGHSVFWTEDCPPTGNYSNSWFGDDVNIPADIANAVVCQKPGGTCCAYGLCSVTTEADCIAAGGTYGGDGTISTGPGDCTDVDCGGGDPGACCYESQGYPVCVETTQANCENNLEGVFQGPGTTCPTENIYTAGHGSGPFTHLTDPVLQCPEGFPRGDECVEGDPIDPWRTAQGASNCHEFGGFGESPPIPADFFGPGSDPFTGTVCLDGVPLGQTEWGEFGDADTLVRRTGGTAGTGDPFDRCDVPSASERTVDVEIVALSLVSSAPVIVTFNGGQSPEEWDVVVDLSTVTPPLGTITAVKTHCNGGTYNSVLPVQPKFTFTKVGDPGNSQVLDTGLEGIPFVTLIQDDDPPWTSDVSENLGLPSPICTDFHPAIEDFEPVLACDCNDNQIRDLCDIENETSQDCNQDGIPDDCQLAGNDCNNNSIPDECEGDCNANGVPDDCDIDPTDPDGNGLVSADCDGANGNGVPDECEFDCNENGVADSCDIARGTLPDTNGNGIPDECELEPPTTAAAPHDILKNRYISIDPRGASGNNPPNHHIRVEVVSSLVNGQVGSGPWWAGPPQNGLDLCQTPCISVVTQTKPASEPDWSGCNTVHLTGCPIIPTTTYAIVAESGGVLSGASLLDTQAKPGVKWYGDCVGSFDGVVWSGPNGTTNIGDVQAAIKTFQNCAAPNATHLSVTDMVPNLNASQINLQVNIADAFSIILGFQGLEYPGPDLTQCP